MPQDLRAVGWTGNSLALIDQTLLPHRYGDQGRP